MSLTSLIALGVLGALPQAPPVEEPPRLRTLLPNGSAVLVERIEDARYLSVQLFVANRMPDAASEYGHRHLLEHLLAKGRDRRMDRKLELVGMVLRADTYRDASRFEVTGTVDQLDSALSAIRELMQPPRVEPDELRRELDVMAQELALEPPSARLSAAAWRGAFGDQGLDPAGSLGSMLTASPESLRELHARVFARPNLVLVAAGPLPVRATSLKLAEFLSDNSRPTTPTASRSSRTADIGRFEAQTRGEARAAVVGSYRAVPTMATLAAALAIATQVPGSFVTYTPSLRDGLVLIGREYESSGLGLAIDELKNVDLARLFPLGRRLAEGWVNRQMRNPSSTAFLRGSLLSLSHAERPEMMIDAIRQVGFTEFVQGVERLRKDKAIVVAGVGR